MASSLVPIDSFEMEECKLFPLNGLDGGRLGAVAREYVERQPSNDGQRPEEFSGVVYTLARQATKLAEMMSEKKDDRELVSSIVSRDVSQLRREVENIKDLKEPVRDSWEYAGLAILLGHVDLAVTLIEQFQMRSHELVEVAVATEVVEIFRPLLDWQGSQDLRPIVSQFASAFPVAVNNLMLLREMLNKGVEVNDLQLCVLTEVNLLASNVMNVYDVLGESPSFPYKICTEAFLMGVKNRRWRLVKLLVLNARGFHQTIPGVVVSEIATEMSSYEPGGIIRAAAMETLEIIFSSQGVASDIAYTRMTPAVRVQLAKTAAKSKLTLPRIAFDGMNATEVRDIDIARVAAQYGTAIPLFIVKQLSPSWRVDILITQVERHGQLSEYLLEAIPTPDLLKVAERSLRTHHSHEHRPALPGALATALAITAPTELLRLQLRTGHELHALAVRSLKVSFLDLLHERQRKEALLVEFSTHGIQRRHTLSPALADLFAPAQAFNLATQVLPILAPEGLLTIFDESQLRDYILTVTKTHKLLVPAQCLRKLCPSNKIEVLLNQQAIMKEPPTPSQMDFIPPEMIVRMWTIAANVKEWPEDLDWLVASFLPIVSSAPFLQMDFEFDSVMALGTFINLKKKLGHTSGLQ